jgi:putative ABC transport system permease protein
MKYLHLIRANLLRKKLRTTFTVLSVLVAFLLFVYLAAVRLAFALGADLTGQDRLVVIDKVSLINPLPKSYEGRLEAIPGVVDAAHATWFGGKYQNLREAAFPIFPVDPEEYLRMYPEFVVPGRQKKAWLANRTGALVGRETAERFGFAVGDRIPIQGTIWRRAGGDTWEFTVEAIYDAEPGVDKTQFLFHYEYFNEARLAWKDLVGWYIVRVEDPDHAAAVAEAIDSTFANSPWETKTSTEKVFVEGFAKQIGNIGKILRAVLSAVFFTLLLVAGTTMAQSVRERTSELAVLKTLGFTDLKVLGLVLSESLVLAAVGGASGLALGWWLVQAGDPTGGFLPGFHVSTRDLIVGAILVPLLGFVAGLLPALQALRLRIVDALRKV